jgi:hypothetical protein
MEYRAHITIEASRADEPAWWAFCGRIGMTPLKLMLSTGETPLQVSCTARSHFIAGPHLAERWAGELERRALQAGFAVLRTKLAMPLRKAEGVYAVYHEAHAKAILTEREALDVPRLCRVEGYSHSRNLLSVERNGRLKHYLTDRVFDATHAEAIDHFGHKAIRLVQWHPRVALELEAVLLDTNPTLDRGWIGA